MLEQEWEQLRTYLEHSGMTAEQVHEACARYQAKRSKDPLPDPRQVELPFGSMPPEDQL